MCKYYLLPVILILTFVSCNKSTPSLVTQTDFPLLVNAEWTYKLADSTVIPVSMDTITLKIMSSETVGDTEIWHCQIFKHNIAVDEGTYTQYGNLISYQGKDSHSLFGNFVLRFAMNNGNSWQGLYQDDSFKVTHVGSGINVLGASYNNVYTIERRLMEIDYSIDQDLLFSKGVGIIRQNYQQFTVAGAAHYYLELISYSLH
jgi:hypothetical protein